MKKEEEEDLSKWPSKNIGTTRAREVPTRLVKKCINFA